MTIGRVTINRDRKMGFCTWLLYEKLRTPYMVSLLYKNGVTVVTNNNNKEAVWGVILSYVLIGVNAVSTLIFVRVLTGAWGKAEYGLYQNIGAYAGFMAIMDFGLSTALTRYMAKANIKDESRCDSCGHLKQKENLAGMFMVIYGAIAVLVMIVSAGMYMCIDPLYANTYSVAELAMAKPMFIMLAAGIVVTVFGNVFVGILSGHEKFIFQKMAAAVKSVVFLAVGISIVKNGANSVILTAVSVGVTVAYFAALCVYTLRSMDFKIRLHKFDFGLARELFGFSVFIFLQVIMAQLYYKVDVSILGMTTSTEVVAVYSVGIEVFTMFYVISAAIQGVVLPRAVKLAQGGIDGSRITDFMTRIARVTLCVYTLFVIGFGFLGRQFIRVWVGDGFDDAYWVVMSLAIVALVPRIQESANSILRAVNKHAFITVMYFAMALANVVATFLLVGVFGMAGAVIATCGALIIGNIVFANIYFVRVLHFEVGRFFARTLQGIWIAIVLSCGAGLALECFHTVNLMVEIAVKAVVIAAVFASALLVWGLNSDEKQFVARLMGKGGRYSNSTKH